LRAAVLREPPPALAAFAFLFFFALFFAVVVPISVTADLLSITG
jgi:hypothetical protein